MSRRVSDQLVVGRDASATKELATKGQMDTALAGKSDTTHTHLHLGGTPVTLTDGSTPALDASQGTTFRLSAAGNRTIGIPSNPTDGQTIVIEHTASGGARTLALNTGTGGFAFGSDITALTATVSAKTDIIQARYNSTANKWWVVGYAKGF